MSPNPINYLPLNIQSRVELYLTQNGLKPGSVLTLRKGESHKVKLENYLKKHNLYFHSDTEDPLLYYVSLHKDISDKLSQVWKLNTEESETDKGSLLGYPQKAVESFVKYAKNPERNQYIIGAFSKDFPRNRLDHWPYIGYIVRKGKEDGDSRVAQVWADFTRKNNPILARWYENIMDKMIPQN